MYLVHSITRLVVLTVFWPFTIVVKCYSNYMIYRQLNVLKDELRRARTYEEWLTIAERIDKFLGKDVWRQRYVSKKYDYRLIYHRIGLLKEARSRGDISRIISIFNSGLIRNFGGITDKNLFNNSYLGTKILIHDYINEVLSCLEFVNQYSANGDLGNLKLQFFDNARRTFGSSALILQGGSIFRMYHLGVIKTLYLNKVLPKIISGSYFGAIFACLICIICSQDGSGDPMSEFFDNFKAELMLFGRENEKELFDKASETSIKLLLNFYRKSYTPEIYLLLKYVALKLGNQTFEELYSNSGKILNIMIYSTDKSLPTIANYITAPNVVVWSAMYASIGSDIMGDIQILVKDLNNQVVPWNNFSEIFKEPGNQKRAVDESFGGEYQKVALNQSPAGEYQKVAVKQYRFLEPHELNGNFESPYERLTELFNVNHFIVSLARLYFKPLVMNDIRHNLHFVKPLNDFDKIIEEAKAKQEKSQEKQTQDKLAAKDSPVDKKTPKPSNWLFFKNIVVEVWVLPITIIVSFIADLISNITILIATPSYTYTSVSKKLQKVLNLEIQYRFNLVSDLSFFRRSRMLQILKKLTVDEKTPKLSSSEITIVPNVKDFLRNWRSISILREINEDNLADSIDQAINFGEKSVWALLPILWVRCSIEFALEDLYNHTKEIKGV